MAGVFGFFWGGGARGSGSARRILVPDGGLNLRPWRGKHGVS